VGRRLRDHHTRVGTLIEPPSSPITSPRTPHSTVNAESLPAPIELNQLPSEHSNENTAGSSIEPKSHRGGLPMSIEQVPEDSNTRSEPDGPFACHLDGPVAVVTMNHRPYNLMGRGFTEQLIDALRWVGESGARAAIRAQRAAAFLGRCGPGRDARGGRGR